MNLTSNFFVLCTKSILKFIYIIIHSGWSLALTFMKETVRGICAYEISTEIPCVGSNCDKRKDRNRINPGMGPTPRPFVRKLLNYLTCIYPF